jgi:hypothetical protein
MRRSPRAGARRLRRLPAGQTIRGTWSVVVGSGGVGVPGGHTDGVGDGTRYGFEVLINGTSPFVADGIWA